MRKKIHLIFFLILIFNASNAQTWINVSDSMNTIWNANHFFSTASIGNDIYIAYQDSGHGNKISIQKLSGSVYSIIGQAVTSGGATNIKLKVFNNTLYLAYTDHANGQKMTMMKYNGTSWQLVGNAGFTSAAVLVIDFDFDSHGNIYAVYNDLFSTGKATVSKFDGSTWNIFGQRGVSYDNTAAGLSITIDRSTDKIYVASTSSNSYTLRTYEYDASNFVFSLHSQFNGTSNGSKILSNSNGKLFLLNRVGQNYQVFKHNGASWSGVGQLISPGVSSNSFDIAVYEDELFMLHAYNGSGVDKLVVFKYVDGMSNVWSQLSVPFGGNENVGVFTYGRIVKTADNKIYVTGRNDSYQIPYVYKYDQALAVNDFETELKVLLSPNPVHDLLNIQLDSELKSLVIYNSQGQKVMHSDKQEVNVSNLAAGVYLVRIEDFDNKVSTKKIVIK